MLVDLKGHRRSLYILQQKVTFMFKIFWSYKNFELCSYGQFLFLSKYHLHIWMVFTWSNESLCYPKGFLILLICTFMWVYVGSRWLSEEIYFHIGLVVAGGVFIYLFFHKNFIYYTYSKWTFKKIIARYFFFIKS